MDGGEAHEFPHPTGELLATEDCSRAGPGVWSVRGYQRSSGCLHPCTHTKWVKINRTYEVRESVCVCRGKGRNCRERIWGWENLIKMHDMHIWNSQTIERNFRAVRNFLRLNYFQNINNIILYA